MSENSVCPVRHNVNTGSLSAFGGGVVNALYEPRNVRELTECLRELSACGAPYSVVGACTNVLFCGEIKNVVSTTLVNNVTVDGCYIRAEAGARLSRLVALSLENGLDGLQYLTGIPASVGGAVAMNCGAFGAEIGDYVLETTILSGGSVKTIQPDFSYRSGNLSGAVVLETVLNLKTADVDELYSVRAEVQKLRREKQPFEPSLGSVWKKVGNVPAAIILEKLQVKGLRVGGASVSEKHCNFIVNDGGATWEDYVTLAGIVEARARDELGVCLKREVVLLT